MAADMKKLDAAMKKIGTKPSEKEAGPTANKPAEQAAIPSTDTNQKPSPFEQGKQQQQ